MLWVYSYECESYARSISNIHVNKVFYICAFVSVYIYVCVCVCVCVFS